MDYAFAAADCGLKGTAGHFDSAVQTFYVLLFGLFDWILCVILYNLSFLYHEDGKGLPACRVMRMEEV